MALEPLEIAAIAVDRGPSVVTLLAGANRGPPRFSDPDRFNITRDEGASLSFSARGALLPRDRTLPNCREKRCLKR